MRRRKQSAGGGTVWWIAGGLAAILALVAVWSAAGGAQQKEAVADVSYPKVSISPGKKAIVPLQAPHRPPPQQTAVPIAPENPSRPGAVLSEAPPFDALEGRKLIFRIGRLDGLPDGADEKVGEAVELERAEDFPRRLRPSQKLSLPLDSWAPGCDLVVHMRFMREGGAGPKMPWMDNRAKGEFLKVSLGSSPLYCRWVRSSAVDIELWIPAALRQAQGGKLSIDNGAVAGLELDALWVEDELPPGEFRLALRGGAWLAPRLAGGLNAADLGGCGELPADARTCGSDPASWEATVPPGTAEGWRHLFVGAAQARRTGWKNLLVADGRWSSQTAQTCQGVFDMLLAGPEAAAAGSPVVLRGEAIQAGSGFEDIWQQQRLTALKSGSLALPVPASGELYPMGLQERWLARQVNSFLCALTFAAGHGGSCAILDGFDSGPGVFFPGAKAVPVPQWPLIEQLCSQLPEGCRRIPCNAIPTDLHKYGFLDCCHAAFRRPDGGITVLAAACSEEMRGLELTLPEKQGGWKMRRWHLGVDGSLHSSEEDLAADENGLGCRLVLAGGFVLADFRPVDRASPLIAKKEFPASFSLRKVVNGARLETRLDAGPRVLERLVNLFSNCGGVSCDRVAAPPARPGKESPAVSEAWQLNFDAGLPDYGAAWLLHGIHPDLLLSADQVDLVLRVEGEGSRRLELWGGRSRLEISCPAGQWRRLSLPKEMAKEVLGIHPADGKAMVVLLSSFTVGYSAQAAREAGLALKTRIFQHGGRTWLLADAAKVLHRIHESKLFPDKADIGFVNPDQTGEISWDGEGGWFTVSSDELPRVPRVTGASGSSELDKELKSGSWSHVVELKSAAD